MTVNHQSEENQNEIDNKQKSETKPKKLYNTEYSNHSKKMEEKLSIPEKNNYFYQIPDNYHIISERKENCAEVGTTSNREFICNNCMNKLSCPKHGGVLDECKSLPKSHRLNSVDYSTEPQYLGHREQHLIVENMKNMNQRDIITSRSYKMMAWL